MGVYIKGMEIPTMRQGYLGLVIDWAGRVYNFIPEQSSELGDKIAEAIPVPPHGRLIDADAFEAFIRKDWDKNDHWIAEVVYSRPTIIPAEETLKVDCTIKEKGD